MMSYKSIKMLGAMLCPLIVCGCSSESAVEMPADELTGIRVKGTEYSISLNDEQLNDAYAYFVSTPLKDDLKIVLSGVHPDGKIEMEVAAVRDGEGNIVFEGEETVENVRQLKVRGTYVPPLPAAGMSTTSPSVKIDIEYTIPDNIYTKEYTIHFDGNSGFFYNRDRGVYPLCPDDLDAQRDSCEFISGKINRALQNHLKSMSFRFGDDGNMTFAYATSDDRQFSRTFRYWVGTTGSRDEKVIDVEDGEAFNKYLLNAIHPTESDNPGNMSEWPDPGFARIFIDDNNNNKDVAEAIAIWGDLHYKIFPYLYEAYCGEGIMSDNDKGYIHNMVKTTTSVYRNPSSWVYYRWAFANIDR